MRRITNISPTSYREAVESISLALSRQYRKPYSYSLSVLSSLLNISKEQIILNLDKPLTKSQIMVVNSANRKLLTEYPISYILGNISFYNENYIVNDNVLIPRPETELLVETAIGFIDKYRHNLPLNILEVGTGSGCISISILNNIKNLNVQILATDVSNDALEVANLNVKENLHKIRLDLIKFASQDILIESPNEKYDLIISNPPYIPFDEYKKLGKSLFYEPQVALTDFGDGLKYYERLAIVVHNCLKADGNALFELHSINTSNILKIFKNVLGNSVQYEVIKDVYGRKRMLKIIT
mgnify:CR=1 FL=1